MSADRFTAGKSTDRLVDNRLEDGCRKILAGCTFIDQRLDIGFGKYTTSCSDRVDRFIILGKFI